VTLYIAVLRIAKKSLNCKIKTRNYILIVLIHGSISFHTMETKWYCLCW